MADKYKNKIIYAVVAVVFLLQLRRGLGPNEDPFVAAVSALMAACAALVFMEAFFWLWSKCKKKRG